MSYTMSYIISYTISFSQAETMCRPAVPVPLQAPDSGDEDGDRPLNSDDELDFQDQQSSPPSPMHHYPAPKQILREYASASSLNARDIKRLIEDVLHNPDFNADDVDTDMLELLANSKHASGRRWSTEA